MPGAYRQETVARSLYDMANDPYETTDVLAEHPDVVARLDAHAERHRRQFYETE